MKLKTDERFDHMPNSVNHDSFQLKLLSSTRSEMSTVSGQAFSHDSDPCIAVPIQNSGSGDADRLGERNGSHGTGQDIGSPAHGKGPKLSQRRSLGSKPRQRKSAVVPEHQQSMLSTTPHDGRKDFHMATSNANEYGESISVDSGASARWIPVGNFGFGSFSKSTGVGVQLQPAIENLRKFSERTSQTGEEAAMSSPADESQVDVMKPKTKKSMVLSFCCFTFGLAAIACILAFAQTSARNANEDLVETRFESFTTVLVGKIQSMRTALKLLAFPFATSNHISRSQFSELANIKLEPNAKQADILPGHQLFQAIEWAPCVLNSSREALETEAGNAWGLNNPSFHSGNFQKVIQKSVYIPVYYMEPFDENQAAALFDLSSSNTRLQSMREAASSRTPTLTPPLTLVQEHEQQKAALMFVPVFSNATRMESCENLLGAPASGIIGFVLGVFRLGDLVQEILQDAPPVSPLLGKKTMDSAYVTLFDEEYGLVLAFSAIDPSKPDLLLESDEVFLSMNQEYAKSNGLGGLCEFHRAHNFSFGGRQYSVHICLHWDGWSILGTNQWVILSSSVLAVVITIAFVGHLSFIKVSADLAHISKREKQTSSHLMAAQKDLALQQVEATKLERNALCNFMTATSHDMRSSLQVMTTSVESLDNSLQTFISDMNGNLNSSHVHAMKEDIRTQQVAIRLLSLVVNNSMDASLIMMNRVERQSQDVVVRNVLQDIANAAKAYLQVIKPSVQITCDFSGLNFPPDGHLPSSSSSQDSNLVICSDLAGLSRSLNNLVSNAVKFTSSGSIQVSACFEPSDLSAGDLAIPAHSSEWKYWGSLRISVKDSGIGMTEDQASMCFDPFRHAKSAQGGGTGLGLFLVKRFFEDGGGSISLETSPNHGCEFTCCLPCHAKMGYTIKQDTPKSQFDVIAGDAAKQHLPMVSDDLPTCSKRSSTPGGEEESDDIVLFAEDQPINLQVGLRMLSSLGFRVKAVTNGQELLEHAISAHDKLAVVLSDIDMPLMCGDEAISQLRKWESSRPTDIKTCHRARLPCIAITGNASESIKQRLLESGFDAVLAKPASRTGIKQAIEKVLVSKEKSS